jgi:polyketide synthase PksJ
MDKKLDSVLDECIAIIGIAGKFPGANDVNEFWKNLCLGKESISFFSDKELIESGISQENVNNPNYVKAKGIVEDIDKFDAKFFGISPRDATILDPQQRIFLECVWGALEDAGYYNEEQAGRIGVFSGSGFNTYYSQVAILNREFIQDVGEFNLVLGNANDFLATRVSYKFNFTGPSITLQTACSTSLVAVCQACNSLLDYQCDMAVAGGVSAFFPVKSGYHYQEELIFSVDGHCRALDAGASGTLFGMGVGTVILKRLPDAIKDGDQIYAIIRGFAVNNDGANKVGYTAPAQNGQTKVIIEAQTLAQVDPDTIQYIEAHATGTQLGDPIEIAALTDAFKRKTNKKNFCAVGTLKSNIGHLDTASGIAALIKTVLVLKNKKIPPAVNFTQPNPKLDLDNSPFYIPTKLEEWKSDGQARRAGVSAFGVGGTNAHVILEEAPVVALSSPATKPFYLMTLSAKSEKTLKQKMLEFETWLCKQTAEPSLEDISYTLNVGRKHFEKRCAFVVKSIQELAETLSQVNKNNLPNNYLSNTKKNNLPESEFNGSITKIMDDLENYQTLKTNEYQNLLLSLGNFYVKGHEKIDWKKLHQTESRHRISLPTYPFERERYWIPSPANVTTTQASIQPPAEVKNAKGVYYYRPAWKTDDTAQFQNSDFVEQNANETILVIGSDEASTVKLVSSLRTSFHSSLIYAKWGDDYVEHDETHYTLHPEKSEHYTDLIKALAEKNKLPRYVIFLQSLLNLETISAADVLQSSFYPVFFLSQTLLKQKNKGPVDCVYSYFIDENTRSPFVKPFFEALSSLWKSISLEHPQFCGRLLQSNLKILEDTTQVQDVLIETLAKQDIDVRYHHGQRQIKYLQEIEDKIEPGTTPPFRSQGTYIITGGVGGLGLILAKHIAMTYHARLILIGRSELNSTQLDRINQLIDAGCEIIYEQGDVAKEEDTKRIFASCRSRFGAIHGILHCAGSIHDDFILKKTHTEIAEVLAAKVFGTLNLLESSLDDTLDCFVLFSSMASLFGNFKQSDYAYANGFIDAIATQHIGRICSINWPLWIDGGMQTSETGSTLIEKITGIVPLSTALGLNAFDNILSDPSCSQIAVLSGYKQKITQQLIRHYNSAPLTTSPAHQENMTDETTLLESSRIESYLITQISESTSIPPEELDVNTSLFELGLDSIVLSQLISRIQSDFDISLEECVQEILVSPTILNITTQIVQLLSPNQATTEQNTSDKNDPLSNQIVIL